MNNLRISHEELKSLNLLLDNGLSMKECLLCLFGEKNALLKEMEDGQQLERCFPKYCSRDFACDFLALLPILNFRQCLSFCLMLQEERIGKKERFLRHYAYPLVLTIVSFAGLFGFRYLALPALENLLSGFSAGSVLNVTTRLLECIINMFLWLILILLSLFLVYNRKNNRVVFFMRFSKYFRNTLWHRLLTLRFAQYYELCLKMGFSTRESIGVLRSLRNDPLIRFMAYHIDEGFEKGLSMDEVFASVYIHEDFSRYIRIGLYTKDPLLMVERYLTVSLLRIQEVSKKTTVVIQSILYLLIGLLIIGVYQILMIPMNAIGLW